MARSKYEIRATKELEADGYRVDWKVRPPWPIKGYNVDYFNLFDLLAYKQGEPLRWISIKYAGSGSVKPNRLKIMDFTMPRGNQKEQWRYDRDPKDRRKIRARKQIID